MIDRYMDFLRKKHGHKKGAIVFGLTYSLFCFVVGFGSVLLVELEFAIMIALFFAILGVIIFIIPALFI